MIFSVQDMELMRLLYWCGNILPASLNEIFDEATVQNLLAAGLIHMHKNSGSYSLTKKGGLCLSGCPVRTPLSYRKDLIERRLRISDIVLTAYQSRLELFADIADEPEEQLALFLPSLSRGRERNIWGSSRVAALLRLGNCCCGVYSVYPGVGRLNLEDEEKTLSACATRSRSRRTAFFFTGDTYRSILSELERTDISNDGRLISCGEAWQRTVLPVYLLPHGDTGALQLRIMAQPDYRKRLARAGLGEGYAPPPPELPHCDGMLRGIPFAIAADMELRRLDAVLEETRRAGFSEIAAAALREQVRGILRERYGNRIKLFTITKGTLTAAFGDELPLYRPGRGAFLTEKGDVVDVPSIQAHRKAGGSR